MCQGAVTQVYPQNQVACHAALMRTVDPPRQVWVRRGDVWHRGTLEAWRRDEAGWLAYVRYTVAVGMRHLEWVAAEAVRPG